MKSWEFHDCIKYKDFGDWIIKTDEYVAGLWFLVRFGGDCDSCIIYIWYTLGCFSVMVASYERDEFCVLK